jgi:hypothetical protein
MIGVPGELPQLQQFHNGTIQEAESRRLRDFDSECRTINFPVGLPFLRQGKQVEPRPYFRLK